MLNYDVKEGKEKIKTNGILNVEGSRIYKNIERELAFRIFAFTHVTTNYIKLYRRL